jgi:hypothetical protein
MLALTLLLMGAAAAAPIAALPPERFVRWNADRGSETIAASGLTLHVEPRLCGNGRRVSEACAEGSRYLVVTVGAPGLVPATIMGEAGVAAYIGVGKLEADATRPSVILITEDGGSAGCVQIDLAVPDTPGYRIVRLSADDADHGTLCHVDPGRLAWPRDLSGHDRAEFVTADGSFYCHFTSCAGTWYPPRIIAFDGRRGVDVSSDPALAPLFRADLRNARFACEHRAVEAQGACAGFAADAARLGWLRQTWPLLEAQVRGGCRVRHAGECAAINRIPADFPAQLAAALRNAGYVRAD